MYPYVTNNSYNFAYFESKFVMQFSNARVHATNLDIHAADAKSKLFILQAQLHINFN